MEKMKVSKKSNNSGMPTWVLSLIIIAVLVMVLAICLVSVITSSGVISRMTTAMKTENFKINQNMMDYFYHSAYSTFVSSSTYSTLKNGYSLNSGANQGLPLTEQKIGDGQYDNLVGSDYNGKTWHDFFLDKAVENAKSILAYCEEAEVRSITLDDTDLEAVDANISTLILSIKYSNQVYYNMEDNALISEAFGKGVKKNDIKDAMKLMSLSSKVQNKIIEELTDAITTDRINSEYNENSKEYDFVDYLRYAFDVKYETVSKKVLAEIGEDAKEEDHKDEILAEYKKQIEEAIAKAAELAKITDKDEFLKAALTYYLDENYSDIYDDVKESDKLVDDVIPDKETEDKIKAAMIEKLFEEFFVDDRKSEATDDVEERDGKYYVYDIEVEKAYGEFITNLKNKLFTKIGSEESSILNEKSKYTKPAEGKEEDEDDKWLFDSDRKAGDVTVIDDGDGADGAEIEVDKKYFSTDVYLMIKPRYIDDTPVRNGAYMIFTSEDSAKSAIESLGKVSSLTTDAFLTVASATGAGNYTELSDYIKGQMGSDDFDEWMFSDERKQGDYTTEAIKVGSSSFIVGYFDNVGERKAWQATVKSALLSDDLTAEQTRITEKFTPTVVVKDSVMGRVGK